VSIADRVRVIVEPLVSAAAVELVDVEHTGGTVRVSVDRAGGVDLDVLARLTRQVSRALDEQNPLPGRYTLEVSSPGLERPLRTPEHFRRAVGMVVVVKTLPDTPGERRLRGELVATDDDTVTVRDEASGEQHTVSHADIEKARTVFEWGPAPKPGAAKPAKKRKKANA